MTQGASLRIPRAEIAAKLLANSQMDQSSGSWAIQFNPSSSEWEWLLVEKSRMDFDGTPWGLKAGWVHVVLPHPPREGDPSSDAYAESAEGFIEQAKNEPQNTGMPFPDITLV